MAEASYTEWQVETALCLWEAICEAQGDDHPWMPYREGYGTSALRLAILNLVEPCDTDWEAVKDNYTLSFDWDFVPQWMADNIVFDDVLGMQLREPRIVHCK